MGQVLLEEMTVYEVREVMKQVRRNDGVPPRLKENLNTMARIAKRHIKLTEHLAGFSGKYKESFPDLARGICKTFYADDLELATCFSVTERTIQAWKERYSDFKKGIKYGKSSFTRHGGSFVLFRRWFRREFGRIANNICREFNPDDEQLARCLDVDFNGLKKWMATNRKFSDSVRCGRRIASGETDKVMEGVARSMGGSIEQSGNAIDNEEQEKKSGSEQRENPTDNQTLQE